jgi:F-type H+-transporting ATPase subunit b
LAALFFGYGSHSQGVDFVFRSLTFAGFIFVLWVAGGEKLKVFFNGRRNAIAGELSSLESSKEEAANKLKDVEAQIVQLDKERQTIIAAYRAQGEAVKSEIIVKAEKNARQIIAQAKLAAQSEAEKAMRKMRADLAEEIYTATERMLRERLDDAAHEKLINKSLDKVVLQ